MLTLLLALTTVSILSPNHGAAPSAVAAAAHRREMPRVLEASAGVPCDCFAKVLATFGQLARSADAAMPFLEINALEIAIVPIENSTGRSNSMPASLHGVEFAWNALGG